MAAPRPDPAALAPYREVTTAAMVLGIVVGIILTASFTYAGLIIGFTVPASAVAAIIGWGVLRGLLKRGSIVENNINQTVAAGINITCSGVIFTLPALFLLGRSFNVWPIALAAVAGGFLGVLFIIPLRKQMVELDRLRFPTGFATATILRSPGAGVRKTVLLLSGAGFAFVFAVLVQRPALGLSEWIPETVDLGKLMHLPPYVANVWALSLLSVGAGFISGRAGLVVLAGGVLANWIVAPALVWLHWAPADAGIIYRSATRPVGIGLLVGGAVVGVALILPMVRAAFAGMGRARAAGASAEELPVGLMFAAAAASVVLLTAAASWAAPIGVPRALLTALLATLWLWLAGIIVAQCTGLTDWSPLSGLALIAVTIVLLLTRDVVAAITIGVAVCVATSHAADMMTDLKTGHLVGSRPLKQQTTQLATVWIGPLISIAVLFLIQHVYGIGNAKVPAPQAQALQAAIQGVQGGNVPYGRYAAGALIGGLLTLGKGGGIGVLVGLSMYLPIAYILPYGLGCVVAVIAEKVNQRWADETGLPIAAGLLVGDSLAGVVVALISVGLELFRRWHG